MKHAGTMFALAAVMLLSTRVYGNDTTPGAEGAAPAEAAMSPSDVPADTGAGSAEVATEPPLPTVPVDAAAVEALPGDSVQLDEVVVTAQRRRWVAEGRLKNQVDVVDGLEQAPAALQRLFTGENLGKQLVRLAEPKAWRTE